MRISVGKGTYVVAVSGGVDSMVLLDLLRTQPGVKLIVAHFDHGIREDSAEDRKLVQAAAKKYKLPFVHKNGALGPGTSAAAARRARYEFLHEVRRAGRARAIITAHHQDDMIETAILNLLRGSGRRGLTSLKTTEVVIRPLLDYRKDQLREYALNHSLAWREDPSNQNLHYTRNYIRHQLLPRFSAGHRAQLLILLEDLQAVNHELDVSLINLLHTQPALDQLDRHWFIGLPHDIAKEVLHAWLRRYQIRNLARRTVERLIVVMKTGRPGQQVDVDLEHVLMIGQDTLALTYRDR